MRKELRRDVVLFVGGVNTGTFKFEGSNRGGHRKMKTKQTTKRGLIEIKRETESVALKDEYFALKVNDTVLAGS